MLYYITYRSIVYYAIVSYIILYYVILYYIILLTPYQQPSHFCRAPANFKMRIRSHDYYYDYYYYDYYYYDTM